MSKSPGALGLKCNRPERSPDGLAKWTGAHSAPTRGAEGHTSPHNPSSLALHLYKLHRFYPISLSPNSKRLPEPAKLDAAPSSMDVCSFNEFFICALINDDFFLLYISRTWNRMKGVRPVVDSFLRLYISKIKWSSFSRDQTLYLFSFSFLKFLAFYSSDKINKLEPDLF